MQTGVLGSGGLSVSLDGKQQNWMNPGGMRHHSGWLGNGEYFINGDGLIRGRKWDEPYKNVDTGEFGDLHILSIAHMGDFSRMGTSGRWAVGGGNGGGSTISIGDLRSGDGYKFLHPLSVIAVPEGLSGDKSGYYDAEPKGSPDGTKFSFTTSADLINGTHTFATKTQTETTTNTISVESTEGFPAKGYLLWGNKDGAVAHYTSITATSFEGVTLAVDGTKNNRVSKGKWLAPLDERLIPEDEHTATGKDALVKLFPDSMLQRQRKMGLWFAVHRSPDRPWLRINGATLELIPGENHSETKGYIIYRNGKALSDQPVTSVKLTMPGKYQAVAVEWSGLKSELSKAVDVIEGITKLSILKERPTDFSWTNTQWIVGGKAVNESQAMKADGSERQTIHLVDGIIAKTSYQSGKKVFHQDLNADKKPIRQLFYKEGKLTRRDHKNADGKLVSREVFDQDERVSHQIIFEHHHHVFDEVQEHWIFNKGEMMALYTLNGHSRSGKKSGTYKNQHGSEWTKVSSENTLGYDYKKFN
jgi:hypothetical protein